jgi:hypothetical protein
MRPQEQHELHAPVLRELRGMGHHLHSVPRGIETRWHGAGASPLGDFHNAEATGTVWYKPFVVAQGWNANARFASGVQDGGSTLDRYFNAVNGQGNHRNLLTRRIVWFKSTDAYAPPLQANSYLMAPNLQ